MSRKRGPYSSPRQQQRRREILIAARSEVEKHGPTCVTMTHIAQASNVSTKTLYNLYGSRELLLLAAAAELLDDLEESDNVQGTEPGIPRLLAYTESAMRNLQYGDFARYIIRILLAAESDQPASREQLARIQRIAWTALHIAASQGELVPDVDIDKLSHILAANQWGIALLWEKGLIDLGQLKSQTELSHCLTLAPVCRGRRKTLLSKEIEKHLGWTLSPAAQRPGSCNDGSA